MVRALGWCHPAHGWGGYSLNPDLLHRVGGYPQFDGWPMYSTLAHQQAYIDWVRRAYEGGLRLVCCSAVNNELLAKKFPRDQRPHDDRSSVDRQLDAMHELVAFIDRQSGGKGKGWIQIATSSQQAREIIEASKLAVVPAVEVDSLGNWRTSADLPSETDEARLAIRNELKRLYDKGVRLITPIHLTDNAFGGAAVYNRLFDALNLEITGEHYIVEDASSSGIEYRLEDDRAGGGVVGLLKRLLAYGWDEEQSHSSHTIPGGQANAKGLSTHGRILIEEMMRLGMVIDIDHMSQKTAEEVLALMESVSYPVVASHAAFRDLALPASETSAVSKRASEGLQTALAVERIRALGGIVAPILNPGEVKAHDARVANDCAGSSKSWAQAYLYAVEKMGGQGVALGSDVNGLCGLPGPRFATHAAHALCGDDLRRASRRDHIERQDKGVRYDAPLEDYRSYRWEGETEDGYSSEEAWTFEAIALADSNEDLGRVDISPDRPAEAAVWVLNVAKGLRAASIDDLAEPSWWDEQFNGDAARLQRGAFHARDGKVSADTSDPTIRRVCERVAPIKAKFLQMEGGNNGPLPRSVAGRRDFDVNIDGMAHYGLLPDFIQDLRNVGLTDALLTPLFRSAEHFVRMWEKSERQGSAFRSGVVIKGVDRDPTGVDLEKESVRISSTADRSVDMTGWTLEGGGQRYEFPLCTLPASAELHVWTGSGQDDVENLFWDRGHAVWADNRADTAVLRDADGTERSRFTHRRPPEPPEITPLALPTATRPPLIDTWVTVRESDGDVDTGVDLAYGDHWDVLAMGTIWAGVWFTGENGPEGWADVDHDPKFPLHEGPEAHPFCLLGKLGAEGRYFYVGNLTRKWRHSAQETCRLLLRTNDDMPGNGRGKFNCRIRLWS